METEPTKDELVDALNRNTATIARLEESLNTFNRWVATFITQREVQHREGMELLGDAVVRLSRPWWKRGRK